MRLAEIQVSTQDDFHQLMKSARPAVMRGLVSDWPSLHHAGDHHAMARYLGKFTSSERVSCVVATPESTGRFFYRSDMTGFNFGRRDATLADLLQQLIVQADAAAPLFMAMQSAPVDRILPGFADTNPMPLLPAEVRPRIWIGNRVRVATHYDSNDNIACVVSGRRRFTLFPPDQIANLYPGPLEMTPAGTPVSMVDVDAPDLQRFPRFAEAQDHALTAELSPGDAIFIPYLWWHAVTSLDPLSILVNYWWNAQGDDTHQLQAMLHALLAFRDASPERRDIWAALFDHWVFQRDGDPASHIAPHARGILGRPSADAVADLSRHLAQSLAARAGPP